MYFKPIIIIILLANSLSGQSVKRLDKVIKQIETFRKSDPDKALHLADSALDIANREILYEEAAELNFTAGMLNVGKGNYPSALEHFNKILSLGKKTSNAKLVGRANINIGNIYVTQGKYNSALDHYLAALKFFENINDKNLLYFNYLCLGINYYYLKNYEKSIGYYEKCLAINKEQNDVGRMAYAYNTMGVIYKETGNYRKAMEYLLETERIAKEAKDSTMISHNMGNLGELYGLTGNFDKAKNYLENGLSLLHRFKDDKGIGENLVLLGNLHLKFNKSREAITYYKEALALSERTGINEIKKDAGKGLSGAYEALGDFKEALIYNHIFSSIKDSLFNSTSSMQIADMQTRYETEKKEKENTILLKENDEKSFEIQKQKNQRNIIFIALSILLLVGLLLYNGIRLRHRNKILAEKELRHLAVFQAQEQEKMQLSKELHDGLGPLLSLIKLNVSTLPSSPENVKLLSEVKELTNESIKEVRNISHALAPSLLQKQGLEAALNEFLGQVNNLGFIRTVFEYKVTDKLSPEIEINLFRIAQEITNNAVKHSGGNLIEVKLIQRNDQLDFIIEDNGKGFTPDKIAGGNGLNNIYSRVDFLKGKVEFKSKEGKGTTYFISLPLRK